MKLRYAVLVAFVLTLVVVPGALAQVPGPGEVAPQPDGEVVTGVNINLVLVSLATTLITYVLNYFGPAMSLQAKGAVLILTNAAAACVYQLLSAGNFGWNTETLVAVGTALGTAAFANGLLFKPTGLAHALGANRNSNGEAVTNRTLIGSTPEV